MKNLILLLFFPKIFYTSRSSHDKKLCAASKDPINLFLILAGPPTAQKLFVSSEDPINLFHILRGPATAQKLFVSSEDPINLFLILAGPPTTQKLFVSSEDPINLFLILAGPPMTFLCPRRVGRSFRVLTFPCEGRFTETSNVSVPITESL